MSNEIDISLQNDANYEDSVEIMITGSTSLREIGYSVKYKDVCLYITVPPLEKAIQKAYKNGSYKYVNVGWKLNVKSKHSYSFEKGGALPLFARYDKSTVFRSGSIPLDPNKLTDHEVEYANGLDGDFDMMIIAITACDILDYAERMDGEKLWDEEPCYERDYAFILQGKEDAAAKALIREARNKIGERVAYIRPRKRTETDSTTYNYTTSRSKFGNAVLTALKWFFRNQS